jgi:hypothetical protein
MLKSALLVTASIVIGAGAASALDKTCISRAFGTLPH